MPSLFRNWNTVFSDMLDNMATKLTVSLLLLSLAHLKEIVGEEQQSLRYFDLLCSYFKSLNPFQVVPEMLDEI